ncbi:hypothetical protein VPFG_00329 [Vibrio phage nt-1]|uniref:Uncharacterized protein n=1 Tax=Vibrio phage nt-1 TaxID=115992 RepID=R9TJP2_9CAUD|nr:hypothetical protein VPFG_00329 [Vibrio phage nt-1]AGN30327.1 hypothetical protein VPFG_00329 [Vibrio phage nt-1]
MSSVMIWAAAWAILMNNQWLLRVFCLFGWHTWEYTKGSKRVCKHCQKRQSLVRVGKDSDWQ